MVAPISSTVTGVAGFDVKAAVSGLLAFDQLAIDQATKKQTAETTKQNAFSAINAAMLSFKSTAVSMADQSKFFAYTASVNSSSATVPASSLLDVTGTNSVSSGKHKIVVEQVAQAERLSSSAGVSDGIGGGAVTSDQTPLNRSGTFNIGNAVISVATGDSLQNIVSHINQQNASTGVTASVIKVASNDFRLVMTSDATGAAGFTLSGAALDVGGSLAGLNLGATGANARQVLAQAQDARVNIDGLSVTRSSNSISDALSGVTLNLKQADPGVTVNMDIQVDTTALQQNVQAFVDAYNGVQSLVNKQFQLDPATGTTGVLAAEGVLTSIQSTLSNSLLQTIPGLASDRNSMVSIGVEPDAQGVLTINHTLFDKFLTTDTNAIRDVFSAKGQSSNPQTQFLTTGLNTQSGTYQIQVSQPAVKASMSSDPLLNLVTTPLASNEKVTITEASSGQQAIVQLTAGQNQNAILAALNAEFSKVLTDTHQLSNSLGANVTAASTLASLGVSAGDSISISGTNRQGGAVQSSFSVLDPNIDTVGSLLSSIQSAFGQQVIASVDATGHIQVADVQSGSSQLSIHLSSSGSLSFGQDVITTDGRYAMNVLASAQGNGITIQGKSFGTSSDFSIAQDVNGLGIANGSASGQNVAGSISGASAMGSGQLLIGNSGNTDGLGVLYTGSATGNVATITLGVGLAAQMESTLDLFANPFTGLIQNSMASSQTTYDDLTKNIADMQRMMDQKRVSLNKQFTAMQTTLSSLKQSGSFLTQQVNAQNAPAP